MQLTKKEVLVTGLALLAMFLGAGNLIFPPMLGLQAGEMMWWAVLGFVATGVGLPLLGVTAVAKAGGDLQYLANRVHPLFSKVITTVVVLSIGPLLAIPRTAATTFEVGIAPFLQLNTPGEAKLALAISTFIFFGITLLYVLRPTKIVDNVGKFLMPALLLFLGVIIYKGMVSPMGTVGVSQYTSPFAQGFLEGYNTMDALASVIFGLVIVNAIKAKGITNNNEIARVTIWAGVIAAAGLAAVYVGLAYVGATSGSNFTGDNPGQLLAYLTKSLLGSTGQMVVAITIALACLTTAIGLVSSCGRFFNRLTNEKISYNTVCIIAVLVSLLLSNMGLAKILEVSVPLLVTVHPIVIVLVLLSLAHNLFGGKKPVYVAAVGGTTVLVLTNLLLDVANNLGIKLTMLSSALSYLPMREQGLEWVIPAIVMAVVGLMIKEKHKAA
ncbi:branched-chain amino acid transport system II carrier protein [Desulfofalx alkaliphila]|uniref:branched-chain amino acid transport system II carrier protein n=1 Tax=Desulfofalx alkaliphila TaxID=105483 RepID=UPI0004E23B9C|nr:branched-chain amino acid transport system II carrier protein [Desulfofalx alkaliphila]